MAQLYKRQFLTNVLADIGLLFLPAVPLLGENGAISGILVRHPGGACYFGDDSVLRRVGGSLVLPQFVLDLKNTADV